MLKLAAAPLAALMALTMSGAPANASPAKIYNSTWHDKVKVPKYVAGKGKFRVVTPSRAYSNQKYTVIGRVKGETKRSVKVQIFKKKKWRTVKTLKAKKRVVFITSTSKTGTVKHRFVVKKKHRAKRYISATAKTKIRKPKPVKAQRKVIAQPAPNPVPSAWMNPWDEPEWSVLKESTVGGSTEWAYIYDKLKIRWDNCLTVTWSYDPTLSYSNSEVDVTRAFKRVSALSKIRFKKVPLSEPAQITVKWAPETAFPHSRVAGTAYTEGREVRNKYQLTRAEILLNADQSLEPQLYPSHHGNMAWGQVFHHEIGHAVGLAHTPSNSQVMYNYVAAANYRFGAGDRTGLAAMGKDGECSAY